MDERVSIIIPVYNGEHFIERSLKSILDQTYDNIECIVVNDGSIDKTDEKIENLKPLFQKRGYILKYLGYSENCGPSVAVCEGLKEVTGEYLSLLDADDVLMKDSIRKRAEFLNENHDCNIVITDGYRVYEDDIDTPLYKFSETTKSNFGEDYFRDLVCAKVYAWSGSYMVRTQILWSIYPDREIYKSRYGQNLQIVLPVSYKSKCGYIDIPLMKYINQKDSLSIHDASSEKLKQNIKNMHGYKDIRLYMVDEIVEDEKEKSFLKRKIEALYLRIFFKLYANAGNLDIAEKYYAELKKMNEADRNDFLFILVRKKPFVGKLLNLFRRIAGVFIG